MVEGNTYPTKPAAVPLHPVYTVTDIQKKVRVLDGIKVSYSSWVKLFHLHARGYKVLDHIDGTKPPAQDDPTHESWTEIDAIVLQWIYGTLSDELLVRVLVPDSTALDAWNRIKNLFLNNKGSRAAALEHSFTNLKLTAMPSLDAYCQKLKELADQLSDVDSPVSDSRLVLQLVRGLPREFDNIGTYLNQSMPTWETACSMLQLEAQRQAAREPEPVVAAAVQSSQPPQAHMTTPRFNNQNRNNRGGSQGNSRRYTGNRQGRSQPSWASPSGTSQQQSNHQQPPWASPTGQTQSQMWAPWWTMPPPCPFPTQPGWAAPWWSGPNSKQNQQSTGGNRSAGPSSSRPQPQANLAEVDPLEPTELGAAFQAMTLDPGDSQWYMDTGATNHLSSDPGMCSTSHNVNSIKHIFVGNGHKLPILGSGNITLPNNLRLNNVLYTPQIIKNLISVKRLAIDNFVSVEFDPFGFSVKDFRNGMIMTRHNSDGPLYPLTAPATASNPTASSFFVSSASDCWHDRLGHPGLPVVDFLSSRHLISCNKTSRSHVCINVYLFKCLLLALSCLLI
ncbi:hypothetical protein L1987_65356 [Smallanthus sonchifolius]|uniref:Uncharacterized protein n=1 Tax=Smallanthus sonchifolius TaxID=185202 RepID=A0ACB9BU39_9ASTR|nr:hypothetical protein L1987_65356 [Smallanthus sonchifolius]